jgi:hypothetical protein
LARPNIKINPTVQSSASSQHRRGFFLIDEECNEQQEVYDLRPGERSGRDRLQAMWLSGYGYLPLVTRSKSTRHWFSISGLTLRIHQ